MAIERINPGELGRPSGFSHAVSSTAEKLVFLAGQTALDAENKIVGAGVVEQFERALGNLLIALRAAGGTPSDLVSITIYIGDMDD
jgi:enamine deaminase RidA (YjgF/YER057c/UK114 family)